MTIAKTYSEDKKFTKKMKQSKQNKDDYSAIEEQAADSLVILQDFVIKHADKRAVEMSGYTKKELIGMSIFHLVTPDSVAELAERLVKREQHQSVPELFYAKMLCKDKTIRHLRTWGILTTYKGKPAHICAGKEITERKYIKKII